MGFDPAPLVGLDLARPEARLGGDPPAPPRTPPPAEMERLCRLRLAGYLYQPQGRVLRTRRSPEAAHAAMAQDLETADRLLRLVGGDTLGSSPAEGAPPPSDDRARTGRARALRARLRAALDRPLSP